LFRKSVDEVNRLRLSYLAAALVMFWTATAGGASRSWETLPLERPLPALTAEHHVLHEGASIWCAALGEGAPVILLHGRDPKCDS
jgi:hypothetical protein